jgi:hypothetical protein
MLEIVRRFTMMASVGGTVSDGSGNNEETRFRFDYVFNFEHCIEEDKYNRALEFQNLSRSTN